MTDQGSDTAPADKPEKTPNDARAFSSDKNDKDVRNAAEKKRDKLEGEAIYRQRHPADRAAQPPEDE